MQSGDTDRDETRKAPKGTSGTPSRAIWRVPRPVQRLFDRFPLQIYPANELPLRAPKDRRHNVLHIFTTSSDAAIGGPSFNPGCLKWQAFLKFNNVPFHTVASSNHASPSGALPFLLPAVTASSSTTPPANADPVPSGKLESWIQTTHARGARPPCPDPSLATYFSLLSHSVRLAYLYALYLHPGTFRSVAFPLYIASGSRSALVRFSLEHPLREAALAELLTTSNAPRPTVDASRLLQEADEAFSALSTLLGDAPWLSTGSHSTIENARSESHAPAAADDDDDDGPALPTTGPTDEQDQGSRQRDSELGLFENGDVDDDDESLPSPQQQQQPGMLDAALFAYTHVILLLFGEQEAGSPARQLHDFVAQRGNLVRHRERILERYFVDKRRTRVALGWNVYE